MLIVEYHVQVLYSLHSYRTPSLHSFRRTCVSRSTSCSTITGEGNTGIMYRRSWGMGLGSLMSIYETASSIPHPCVLSSYAYVGMCKHGITVPGGPGIRYCFY
jgi:hypothetical protein